MTPAKAKVSSSVCGVEAVQISPFSMEGSDASDSENEELAQSKLNRKIIKVC